MGEIADSAVMPITQKSYPKTYAAWGEEGIERINALMQPAAEIVASSPGCDRLAMLALSEQRSSPPDNIVFYADCANGQRFYIIEFLVLFGIQGQQHSNPPNAGFFISGLAIGGPFPFQTMSIDIATIGIGMETSGLEKGARAMRDAEKASVGAANAADKVSTASAGAAASYASMKSAVDKLTAEESKHIQKLVDEYKQLGMSRGQIEACCMAQAGMAKGAQELAAAVGEKIEMYKREQAELARTATATRDSTQSMLAMARAGVAAFLGGAVVQGAMAASKAMFDASVQAERLRTMLDFSTGGSGVDRRRCASARGRRRCFVVHRLLHRAVESFSRVAGRRVARAGFPVGV